MSVLSYLSDTASAAVLSGHENASINSSISNLQGKITPYFGASVAEHFTFGSYTRETILPRRLDENSDVDYMVVFSDGGAKPQTYLDRLKRFVEAKYTRSEIKQSHPTIVLELSHIKFELVPAISVYGGYNIPASASNWTDWIATSPNAFNATLTEKNKENGFNIKPLIRLVKYWNAASGYVFASYGLEQLIVNSAYRQTSLKEYVYWAFDSLNVNWNDAQWRKDKLARAKEIVNKTRQYERENMPHSAELEIQKLIPPI